jgi:hypothetical protein
MRGSLFIVFFSLPWSLVFLLPFEGNKTFAICGVFCGVLVNFCIATKVAAKLLAIVLKHAYCKGMKKRQQKKERNEPTAK